MGTMTGESRPEPIARRACYRFVMVCRLVSLLLAALLAGTVVFASTPAVERSTANTAPAVEIIRGPYLQMATPASIVLRWRTNVPVPSRVWFGPAPDLLHATAEEAASTTEHAVRLTDLAPDTWYFYAVGVEDQVLAGGDDSHVFVTAPPVRDRKATRIWVIGDSGSGDRRARQVFDAYRADAAGERTDLWLMLGDNAYPDGTDDDYQEAVFGIYPELLRRSVLWPALGNHDIHSADADTQSGPYFDIFTLPTAGEAGGLPSGTEAYYSFDHANIHFICLDSSQSNRDPTGEMMSWLQQDARATNQDWIIALWHHAPYSKGSHDSDAGLEAGEMRRNALPLLEDAGVDLVLAGHSHSYERSFLVDGHYGQSDTLTPDRLLDEGDGRPDGDGVYRKPPGEPRDHLGAVYVVVGSSGQVDSGSLDHPVMARSFAILGSLVLEIDGLYLHARFLDDSGTTRDDFAIVKQRAGEPGRSTGAAARRDRANIVPARRRP